MEFWIIFLVVFVGILFILVMIYNWLVVFKQICNQVWGDIDVQLKQCYDLVFNFVEMVKGYVEYEKGMLEGVIKVCQIVIDVFLFKDFVEVENLFFGVLCQFFVFFESYLDFKVNQNFLLLQNELVDFENKIVVVCCFFNNVV